MIAVRHRAAREALRCWEFDPSRRVVDVVLGGLELVIPICSPATPRFHAYTIMRSSNAWLVRPELWRPPTLSLAEGGTGLYEPMQRALCAQLGPDVALLLTDAPSTVSEELAQL